MVSPDVVDTGSEYFAVYLSCVYICSAGYAELPVVLLYLLQCLVYHMLSKIFVFRVTVDVFCCTWCSC